MALRRRACLRSSDGLKLHLVVRGVEAVGLEEHIPRGTCSVSIFLVNHRPQDAKDAGVAYAFQARRHAAPG